MCDGKHESRDNICLNTPSRADRDTAQQVPELVTDSSDIFISERKITSYNAEPIGGDLVSTSNGTLSTSNGTLSTSNGTLSTSNGTLSTSNGTLSTSNGTLSTSNGTLSTSNGAHKTSESDSVYEELELEKIVTTPNCHNLPSKISNMQSLMHLLKGNIGTGILALPAAVKHAGLWTGTVGIVCITSIVVHCMHMLIRCNKILCERDGTTELDYANVVEVCLRTGPPKVRRFSKVARLFVNGLLVFTQFGFCSVYMVFVATNVEAVSSRFLPDGPNVKEYVLIVTAILVPYVCVRNLKRLAPFSAFANLLTLTGLLIIIQYIVQRLPDTSKREAFSSIGKLPLFFGTVIFSVEGIALILPLQNSMRQPKQFGGWLGVLNLAMVSTICLYAAVGFYGYLKFGDTVEGSVTLSLPKDDWLYLSVRLMYALAILISYNIQIFVPVEIVWPKMKTVVRYRFLEDYGEYMFRIVMVLVTGGFAVAVPHLDLLISLIGAFAGAALTLMLPAVIEIVTLCGGEEPVGKHIILKNVCIFLFGIFGCVIGTYTSLKDIIEVF